MIYVKLTLMALGWSGSFVAGRYLGGEMLPVESAFFRYLLASMALLATVPVGRGAGRRPGRYDWKGHTGFLAQGLTGVFLYNLLFFAALKHGNANSTAMIVTCNPVVISLVSVIFLGEKVKKAVYFGIPCCLLGVYAMISDGDFPRVFSAGPGRGEIFALACMFSWAAYSLVGKKILNRAASFDAVFYSTLYGTAALGVAFAWDAGNFDPARLNPFNLSVLFYLAIFSTILPFWWFNDGIRKLGAVRSSGFICLVPVFVLVESRLLLDETLSPWKLAGAAAVVFGLLLINGVAAFLWKRVFPSRSSSLLSYPRLWKFKRTSESG